MVRSLDELRNEVRNKITNNNIVGAIIYKAYITLQNAYTIPKSQAFFQNVFFQMKEKHPHFFADFIFDESGVTPFSDELDSVLFRLETSTILPALNPSYKDYDITNSLEVLGASYEKLKDQKDIIDSCAEILSNCIKNKAE